MSAGSCIRLLLLGAFVAAIGYGVYSTSLTRDPIAAWILCLILAILGFALMAVSIYCLVSRPVRLIIDRHGIVLDAKRPTGRLPWSDLKGAHLAVMAGPRRSIFIPRSWTDSPIIALELADSASFHRQRESTKRRWLGYDTGVRPDYVPLYYSGLHIDSFRLLHIIREGIIRQGRPAPAANPQTSYDQFFVGDDAGKAGLIVVLVMLALLVVVVVASRPPSWLEAQSTCEVRNLYAGKQWRRAKTTTVTWTGPCVDGRADGRGVLEWFRDGVRTVHYEGDMSRGRMTGQGKLTERGIVHRGLFESGEFKDGTADYPDGRRYEGKWYKGGWTKGVLTGPDRRRMEGRWYEARMTGIGTAEGPEGRYEGNWYKGQPEGKGLLVTPTGERYEGRWREGKLVDPASSQLQRPQDLDCLWSMASRQFGDRFPGFGPWRCPVKR